MSQLAKNDYEISKQDAFSPNLAVRLKRAKDTNTHPEILYFLASDEHVKVRKAVAKNKSTPYHTIKVLSEDCDESIRKIAVELLGAQLQQQDQKADSKKTFILNEIVEILSQDQSSQIRQVLSETITEVECIPHHIALKIANDVSEKVSYPMLKEFKKFSDDDLIAMLENHDELWRFETIAQRQEVSLKLANFLIDSGYVSVVKKLLAHQKLELSEPELLKIVKLTERHDGIEKHIVNYRALPGALAKKLVQFVGKSVLRTLMRRNDFDTVTIGEIKRIAQRRLAWLDHEKTYPDPKTMAIALYQKKGLTEEVLTDGMSWRKSEFVMIALTLLADSTYDAVSTIFRIKSQKAIMSLAWYIDFSAKFGVLLQKKMADIHPRDILHARQAVDHPLTKDEMEWQLDFFDIL